jgi:two-component system, NtrC family, sensor kinase
MIVARSGRRSLHVQIRPTVARVRALLTLRVRLAVLMGVVITGVVGLAAYLETRQFEAAYLRDLESQARSTAHTISDEVELRPEPLDIDDLAESLREFTEAFPSIRTISVVRFEGGQAEVLASTASGVASDTLRVAREAVLRNAFSEGDRATPIRICAVPASRGDNVFGAVVVTYSVAAIEALRQRSRFVVVWFVPIATVLLTAIVDLLARRLIHKPIAAVRRTMQRAAAGDLSARAPIQRDDEIGEVARGLNEMLAQMEGFNVALREKVREATEELRERNAELVESYRRVFALREALARVEQMAAVGQMAASVAHQIGTPLNLISGYVQMIRQEEGADSPVTRRLQIVEEQIDRVTGIVRTLLDHARRPPAKAPTDIVELVRRVCEVARPKLDAQGVKLDLRTSPGIPLVEADAVQFELALLNLVTNSLDAMPSGGAASITVSQTAGGVRIEVADTGIGIAPEMLPRIFEPWVTTKAEGHGTGLGLSITRDVVAGHGGTITVASKPGAGATFTIDLPAAGTAVPASGTPEA